LAANLRFELTDHLGTVRAVVTGQKTGTGNAEIVSLTDYYPYGMDMPGRSFQSEAYRYGYQGSERDPEMSGGAGYTTYFRALDPRIGRWLTPDPKVFPWQSPYVSMDGNPVALIDPWGASTEDPPAGASSNPLGEGNEATVYGKAPQSPTSNGPSLLSPSSMTPMFFEIDKLVFQKSGFANQEEFKSMMESGRSQVAEKNLNDMDFQYKLTGVHNEITEEFSLFITRTTVRSSLGMSSGGDNVRLVLETEGKNVPDWLVNSNAGAGAVSGLLGGDLGFAANHKIKYAQRINGKVRSPQVLSRAHRMTTLKVVRGLGRVNLVTGVLGTAYSATEAISDYQAGGWDKVDGWDVTDAVVGAAGVGVSIGVAIGIVSNPVGWAVGIGTGLYFGVRLIIDLTTEP
jgi:RHS repeat-associated protein